MEKYSKYRDQATGIAPFAYNRLSKSSLVNRFFQYALGILVLPLALSSLLLLTIVNSIPVVGPVWLKYVVTIALRIFYIDLNYDGERKASVRKSEIQRAQPGDVLVSNFQSPLDPILFESFFECQFVFPNNGKFIPLSLSQAVQQALKLDLASGPAKPIGDIVAQAQKQKKVVVLFGEGTTSNGKGILSLKNVDWPSMREVPTRVFASAINYTPNTASCPLGGSLLSYLWSLETSIYWLMANVTVGKPISAESRTKIGVSTSLSTISRCRIIGDELDIEAKRQYHRVSR